MAPGQFVAEWHRKGGILTEETTFTLTEPAFVVSWGSPRQAHGSRVLEIRSNAMIAELVKGENKEFSRLNRLVGKEDKIDPMWSAEEDDRRLAFARRASSGARKALSGK